MPTVRPSLDLLATQARTVLLAIGVVTAATVVVIAREALRGTEPRHRAALLRSLAEIARALRGGERAGKRGAGGGGSALPGPVLPGTTRTAPGLSGPLTDHPSRGGVRRRRRSAARRSARGFP